MAASINSSPVQRERDLLGQTVVVIGGSSGIGLETARLARGKGADIILTARDPDRLHRAGLELGASIAAFDATDFDRLGRFFDALPAPIDHLLVTGPGPHYTPPTGFDLEREGPGHGGKRGRERRDDRTARCGAAAASAAHEYQGASRADLACGVLGDLQR